MLASFTLTTHQLLSLTLSCFINSTGFPGSISTRFHLIKNLFLGPKESIQTSWNLSKPYRVYWLDLFFAKAFILKSQSESVMRLLNRKWGHIRNIEQIQPGPHFESALQSAEISKNTIWQLIVEVSDHTGQIQSLIRIRFVKMYYSF